MKIREKEDHSEEGFANEFSPQDIEEIIVHFPFYSGSQKIADYEFYVESIGDWVSGERVFDREERLTICNKYNTHFLEPKTEDDRKRGYEL